MRFQDFVWRPEDVVTHLRLQEFTDEKCIFLKSDCLHENKQIEWQGTKHPPIWPPKQKIWISGRSDLEVNDTLVAMYTDNFDRWYGTNNESSDPRIISIPLGMQTNCRTNCVDIMAEVVQEPKVDMNTVYMNFNIDTWIGERFVTYHYLHNQPWVTYESHNQEYIQYCRQIRNSRFVVCPRGNGYDTHRLWETLYLGSIPIVRNHATYSQFNELPIVQIHSWSDLSEDYLEMEYERIMSTEWNFEKLSMDYWSSQIRKGQINDREN